MFSQVMRIVDNVRPDRQTVMFSATFPRAMEALARRILSKPIEVQVGGRSVVCSDVEQQVVGTSLGNPHVPVCLGSVSSFWDHCDVGRYFLKLNSIHQLQLLTFYQIYLNFLFHGTVYKVYHQKLWAGR